MTGRLIRKMAANALVSGVRPSPLAERPMRRRAFGSLFPMLRAMDRRQGGLWVGGTLFVSDRGVRFEPNGLNRALQDGALASEIAWGEVVGVTVRRGVLTNIIEVSHAHGVQAYRCFAAKRVATEMIGAWKAAA